MISTTESIHDLVELRTSLTDVSQTSTAQVFQPLLRLVTRTIGAPSVFVYLSDTRHLITLGETLNTDVALCAELLCQQVVSTAAPLLLNDARTMLNIPFPTNTPEGSTAVAFAGMPLRGRDNILGTLGMFDRHERQWSAEDRAALEELTIAVAALAETNQLYARIDEETRVRQAFLSIAAHDLQNPLTVLLGQTQLLNRRILRNADAEERDRRSIQTIMDQEQRLASMFSMILDSMRIANGSFRLDQTLVNLGALLGITIAELQPSLLSHRLLYQPPAETLMVMGDYHWLEQVFRYLLDNAVKFSPNAEEIEIRLERYEQQVCVSISDHGIGIPLGDQPQLFLRFSRASNAARHAKGMGLGLYLTKEIIQLHHGRIEVLSAEGQGSTFRVWLPCL